MGKAVRGARAGKAREGMGMRAAAGLAEGRWEGAAKVRVAGMAGEVVGAAVDSAAGWEGARVAAVTGTPAV